MPDLNDVIKHVRDFYDPTREPLRRRVYTTLMGLIAVAVAAGLVSGSVLVAVTGPLAAVLLVPATEAARKHVTPVAAPVVPINDEPGQHAVDRVR